jgi:hypothetical protein
MKSGWDTISGSECAKHRPPKMPKVVDLDLDLGGITRAMSVPSAFELPSLAGHGRSYVTFLLPIDCVTWRDKA